MAHLLDTPSTTDSSIGLHLQIRKGGETTMSSREIAEVTGKQHSHVMRDIRATLGEILGEERLSRFGSSYQNAQEQAQPEYLLPKRECLILVSGYDVHLRARIIDKWQELESGSFFDPSTILENPTAMRGILLSYTEKVLLLQGEVEEMRPQVQALERIAAADGSLCITDAAKILQVRPRALFSFLHARQWVYTRQGDGTRIAYQAKLQAGLLEHKTNTIERADGSEKVTTQVRVTPKGLARLAKEFSPVAQAA